MLAVTLALAWYFYDSVQWFEYDVERIAIANSVLNGIARFPCRAHKNSA